MQMIQDTCVHFEINEFKKKQIHDVAAQIVTGPSKLVSIETLVRVTGWKKHITEEEA